MSTDFAHFLAQTYERELETNTYAQPTASRFICSYCTAVMLILGLGLGLRDLALAKKLRPKVLWDYKSHLAFNCRRILFSEFYFKIRVPYILTYLQWTRVVVLDGTVNSVFLVLLSLLYKRLKSTKKQNFTTSSFIASLCIMGWPRECGLGLEWSGLVNITAVPCKYQQRFLRHTVQRQIKDLHMKVQPLSSNANSNT